MRKQSCFQKQKMRKGLWSPEEDEKLLKHLARNNHSSWSSVPKMAGLMRCGKSCRLRWINYLRPDLKRGTFSQEEEDLIIKLQATLGNRWSQIAAQLPGRTDNEIKNLWNSCIKKKLRQKGIDPNTHKPMSEIKRAEENKISSGTCNEKDLTKNSIDHYCLSSLSCSTSTMTLSMSSNQLLWLNQNNKEFGMNQSSSSNFYNSMDLKAVADLPYWEGKNSSFLNGGLCAWPDLTTERGSKYQLPVDNEEMKWSECLQVNFPVSSLPLHDGELKEESYFDMENLNLCFQNH